jgi:hypothetical protein
MVRSVWAFFGSLRRVVLLIALRLP